MMRTLWISLLVPIFLAGCTSMRSADTTATWGPVVLGGGGAVPGIVVHPTVPDLAYIRTDVGGAYRWDEAGRRWIPILDHISPDRWNLYGVESLALDPANGDVVAAALGKYAESWAKPQRGRIVISADRGASWREVGPELAIASNRQQRNGERLAFDASVPGRLWYASMADGLWRGDGEHWERMPVPGDTPTAPLALNCLATHGDTLWIGSATHGVLCSRDGGTTWNDFGAPVLKPNRMTSTADGQLLVTHANGVHRHDGTGWTAITPSGVEQGIQCIAADPRDPRRLIAAERISHKARLFRSDDGGISWRVFTPAKHQARSWWPGWHWVSSPFAVTFDPQHPGRIWLTDWYAAYRCDDIDAAEPILSNLVDGLEEIVSLALASPFGGPQVLMSGVADNGGFDHARTDAAPTGTIWASGGPHGMTCTGIDTCPGQPLLAARVGVLGGDRKGSAAGSWTADGGLSWTAFPSVPGGKPAPGRIAISADGEHLVWALHGTQGIFTSADHGISWQAAHPALDQAVGEGGVWNWQQPLAADRVAPRTFYLLGGPGLWRSSDGGLHWELRTQVTSRGARAVATHPSQAGMLWLALGSAGLMRSDDGGATLLPLPGLDAAELVSCGLGPDPAHPLVYILGRSGSRTGIFVSRDLGATCTPLDIPGQAFGNQPNILAGDQRTAGRCFVGSNGRGILWFQMPR
jgi:xyloglucan-specific exo-beta-1,4-glucanase